MKIPLAKNEDVICRQQIEALSVTLLNEYKARLNPLWIYFWVFVALTPLSLWCYKIITAYMNE